MMPRHMDIVLIAWVDVTLLNSLDLEFDNLVGHWGTVSAMSKNDSEAEVRYS